VSVEGALFYSDVKDAIVAVRPAGFPSGTTQRQNLGNGTYYGAEIALNAALETLSVGANYTYIHRDFDITPAAGVTVPLFALTGVPTHKAFLYAEWKPVPALRITPSLDIASTARPPIPPSRSTTTPAATRSPTCARTGRCARGCKWAWARAICSTTTMRWSMASRTGTELYATAGVAF
jgi:hypothetical protein